MTCLLVCYAFCVSIRLFNAQTHCDSVYYSSAEFLLLTFDLVPWWHLCFTVFHPTNVSPQLTLQPDIFILLA